MASEPQPVAVTDLEIPQLLEVRKQLELELKQLTSLFGQLKLAHTRFESCIDSVKEVCPDNADKTCLLPLTSSLYVPGRLVDTAKVLVDVGTGYCVEKTTQDATRLYKDKVAYLTKNMEQLQETIHRKQDNMRIVGEVLQVKVLQQRAGRADGQEGQAA